MIVQFGLELDDRVFPEFITNPEEISLSCGINGLLIYLEKHLGISHPERHDYLRYEQYRQILLLHLKQNADSFYSASFKADNMATAVALLNRRDELLLGGWDFSIVENMPERLRVMAELEFLIQQQDTDFFDGFAERFRRALHFVALMPTPLKKIYLNEPLSMLPPHIQELFNCLQNSGVDFVEQDFPLAEDTSDLLNFQKALLKQSPVSSEVQADGSLIIIRAKRETSAAEYLAKLFLENPEFRPLCIIPDKNRALDNSLIEEGLPSLGILSASLARPTLQILKLVSTFLWKPINPYKILEFVSLPNTPVHPVLARGVAKAMADKPGVFSNEWNAMVHGFFEYYDKKIEEFPDKKQEYLKEKEEAQKQYSFWFKRKRYDSSKSVPKKDVIVLFSYVYRWATKQLEENLIKVDMFQKRIDNPSTPYNSYVEYNNKKEVLQNAQPALECLRKQSDNILEVLNALPAHDNFLTSLRLERLVKTINEPAAIRFRSAESEHLPFVYLPASVVRPTDDVVWWNFVDVKTNPGFGNWYKNERGFLSQNYVNLSSSEDQNRLLLWQRMQPVLKARKRLILVIPDFIDGKDQLPHPLWGDLCAALGENNLKAISVNPDNKANLDFFTTFFSLPDFEKLQQRMLVKPKPYFYLKDTASIQFVQKQSFTSLNSLLYYPYQWLFNYQAKFRKASILSVTKDRRLMGNIAHSVFEGLFNAVKSSDQHWNKSEVFEWIDLNIPSLFETEGAVLLMYGKEPERIGIINKIKFSAWALLSAVQKNGWSVMETEMKVSGSMAGLEIKGIVDLVLVRGNEKAIVDLKWGGATFRKDQLRNNTDLQLVIYSKLLDKQTDWAHTAFFILESGKLIARNNLAFDEADAVCPDMDFREIHQNIWNSIVKTYNWRMNQIQSGEIEVRTDETYDELEELMDSSDFLDLLEMKSGNAKFDDYQVLINLVR